MLNITPPIIAHRGASLYAPENTLAAFRKAKDLGVNWVEFDVMLTADEEVIVIHDEKLDRTTNLKGWVKKQTLKEIQTCDAGSWFDKQFCTEKIPTLMQVIDLLNELNLHANIEIKAQIGSEEQTVKRVLAIVNQHWQQTQLPLISSFSLKILKLVRQYSATSQIGFLMDRWQNNWKTTCDELQSISVDINQKCLTPVRAKEIKNSGQMLLAYTVNDAQRAHQLFDWGVDAVFTDNPNLLKQ